jgi:hypothetical protein
MQAVAHLDLPASSGAKPVSEWGQKPLDSQVPKKPSPSGRVSEFGYGTAEARTGQDVPGGLFGHMAEDAEEL